MFSVSDLFKGVLIGVANILPGVSGGTLAVSMGIYDQIIWAVTHFFKKPGMSVRTLLPYGLGAVAGIVGFSFSVEYLLAHYPLQTSMAFIGLILGGIPAVCSRIDRDKLSMLPVVLCAVTFSGIVGLSLVQPERAFDSVLAPSVMTALWMILVGVIAAATMVIPGVSGSMILMMLGVYQPLLSCINSFLRNAATLQLPGVLEGCLVLGPFGVGVVFGVFLCARLMEALMERFQTLTYCGILGLVLSSPVVILLEVPPQAFTVSGVISGGFLLVLSFFLTRRPPFS